jgi:hypothetical protein
MSARHQHRGGLVPRDFAKRLAEFYGREGCALDRAARLALLEAQLACHEQQWPHFDEQATLLMWGLLAEQEDAAYADRSRQRRPYVNMVEIESVGDVGIKRTLVSGGRI